MEAGESLCLRLVLQWTGNDAQDSNAANVSALLEPDKAFFASKRGYTRKDVYTKLTEGTGLFLIHVEI